MKGKSAEEGLFERSDGGGDGFFDGGPMITLEGDGVWFGLGVVEPSEAADDHHEAGGVIFRLEVANHCLERKSLKQGGDVVEIFFAPSIGDGVEFHRGNVFQRI